MKHFTEEELNQRYSSYFASKISSLKDVIRMAGIKKNHIYLPIKCLSEKDNYNSRLRTKNKKYFQLSKLKKKHLKFF